VENLAHALVDAMVTKKTKDRRDARKKG